MPISRPLLIVLVGAIFALGAFYATQGSRQAADAPAPAVQPAPEPKPQADASKGADAAKPKADATAAKADRSKPEADTAKQPVQVAKAERAVAKPDKSQKAHAAATSGAAAVKRAIRRDKTVVMYFYGPQSADDSATASAVAGLKGMRGVAVFKAPIRRLTAYSDLVAQLGIAQAPAVVIVGRGRSARVIEGYVDPPTLRQDVADAR